MAEPTAVLARWMLRKQTLCGNACFVFVESTEGDTIPFLFQGEPQVNRLPTAEPRDGAKIAAIYLIHISRNSCKQCAIIVLFTVGRVIAMEMECLRLLFGVCRTQILPLLDPGM